MSYVTRLIGTIEPGIKDSEEKLVLPDIIINKEHILDSTKLREDYGTLGKGLEHIVSNPEINQILVQGNTSDIIVSVDAISGLDNASDAERNVAQTLLTRQYDRSKMLYRLASNKELQDYDNITKGVFKGTALGAIMGTVLNSVQNTLVLTGVSQIGLELVARAGPGLAEAASISHEFNVKENKIQESEIKHLGHLLVESAKEFPKDSVIIAKLSVDKNLWYNAINIGGWIDKIRGKESRHIRDSYTEEWAKAQESGPARGLIALGVLKGIKESYPALDENPALRIAYGAVEALAVFWINTGNNVQGGWSVYKKCVNDAKAIGSTEPWKAGAREYFGDPFQVANLIVFSVWYATEVTLRSIGLRPEEQFGLLGASLESSILSWDTAVVAQLSKPLINYLIIRPAKKSVKPSNLMNLALEHQATELQKKLMSYAGARKVLANYQKA